jgi:hypothetical protein
VFFGHKRRVICKACAAATTASASEPKCEHCNGKGQVKVPHISGGWAKCGECAGTGRDPAPSQEAAPLDEQARNAMREKAAQWAAERYGKSDFLSKEERLTAVYAATEGYFAALAQQGAAQACQTGGKCDPDNHCNDCPYAAPNWDHEGDVAAQAAHAGADIEREMVVVGGKRMGRTYLLVLERDAARYRWLRSQEVSLETRQYDKGTVNGPSCYHEVEGIRELKWGDELDRAVDAAIAASQPQKGSEA